jgi:hypothetical protein
MLLKNTKNVVGVGIEHFLGTYPDGHLDMTGRTPMDMSAFLGRVGCSFHRRHESNIGVSLVVGWRTDSEPSEAGESLPF